MKKVILLGAVVGLVVLYFVLGLNQFLTFDQLSAQHEKFNTWLAAHPILVPSAFFALYVVVTALSLPGATIMTLAAGALFGLWQGLLLASFASSIGATLAFLVARFVLRDTVRQRFGDKLRAVNRGIERGGPLYLFTLCRIPIFPLGVSNFASGLTRLKTASFCWVSQVGMLARTLVYVNTGTQLATIESMSDIFSLRLLLSLMLRGLFPWFALAAVRGLQ